MSVIDFNQFKKTGTYSQFVDDSALPVTQADAPIYLIIIQSRAKNAPINSIVEVGTPTVFKALFGKRDRSQERKGNFSILLAEILLSRGDSIYVLNVRDYDASHLTEVKSLSIANDLISTAKEQVEFASLFDKSTFWKLDREKFATATATNALNFANVRSKNVTFYVRPSRTLPGTFDKTIGEYNKRFENAKVEYLPSDLPVSETFLEIWFFGKDLSSNIATTNPVLAPYLDASGNLAIDESIDVLDKLSKIDEAAFIGKVNGTICQELLSVTGDSYFLENLINAGADTTGVALSIDQDVLQTYIDWDVDEDGPMPLSIALSNQNYTTVAGDTVIAANASLSNVLPAATEDVATETVSWDNWSTASAVGDTYPALPQFNGTDFDGLFAKEIAFLKISSVAQAFADEAAVATAGGTGTFAMSTTEVYVLGDDVVINASDYKGIAADGTTSNLTVAFVGNNRKDVTLQSEDVVVDPATNIPFSKNASDEWIYPATWPQDAGLAVTFTADVAQDSVAGGTPITAPTLSATELEAINVTYGTFTAIRKVTSDKPLKGLAATGQTAATVDVQDPITAGITVSKYFGSTTSSPVTLVRTPEARIEAYAPVVLKGVVLTDSQFFDGSVSRQNEVLDLLSTPTFKDGILDSDKYPFKILCDGFKTFIEQNAKAQLSKLAADSIRFSYIGSLPFIKDFEKSTNPYFKDSATGAVEPAYITEGGNKALPYSNVWSMPEGEANGDAWAAYFSSNLVYSDGVTNTIVPAGPVVALIYGDNFKLNSKDAYSPIGLENGGLISVDGITGVSTNFSTTWRNELESNGYNLIIENASGDLVITNNASAKQLVISVMSSFENSFLVNYVADEVDTILKDVPFSGKNTQELRDIKKVETEVFLDQLVTKGAIGRYTVICDTSNNDAETVNKGYFVIDTVLFTSQGIKIAVHRTIVKANS